MFKLVPVKAVTAYKVTGSVHDVLSVGRTPQSDLCVMDRLVSANHARVSLKGHTLQVVDLDSRNGTEVNGQRLKPFAPHTLRPDDVIDFAGRLALRVQVVKGDGLPTLQVEPSGDAARPAPPDPGRPSGSLLRALRLPPDTPPDLKPERWAAVCALGARLGRRAVQASAQDWLRTLCDDGAAALGVSQLQLLRFVEGRPARVAPEQGACRVRGEALEALEALTQVTQATQSQAPQAGAGSGPVAAVGVELLSADLDALDLQETFDAPSTTAAGGVAPPQIVTLYLGALWVEGRLWGALYATHELSGRRRPLDLQDLWALERLCALVGPALEGVASAQALLRALSVAGGGAGAAAALAALGQPLSAQALVWSGGRAQRLLLPEHLLS